ncbi:MAG TPA: hypothetical protein PK926_03880 [Spirochaetota bacterium]|nr:hypothetical protein [Spirochaetota bacterium]HPI89435.1 hypothetical protein [Spirochaetota bacterium]HPR46897.1 hypothetical protein [Spirochaetota bacterium]
MSITDIFYSPMLKQFRTGHFRDLLKNNRGLHAVHIRYRESRVDPVTECVYLAASMRELTKKVRELHKVQSSMGLPINIPPDKADTSRAFLSYAPLDWRFTVKGNTIVRSETGETIPVRTTRWIADRKGNFNF